MVKVTKLTFVLLLTALLLVEPVFGSYSGGANFWVAKAPMNQAKSHVGVAAVEGKIYAIGGLIEKGKEGNYAAIVVDANEEYDSQTDTWTLKKPMPFAMYGFAIAVFENKIYCMGSGLNQVYDPVTDSWENKTPMPTEREFLKANTCNGKIYLVGGQIPGNYTTSNDTSLSLNEEYEPETDTWTTKAPIPFATRAYASAVLNDKLYIFGGLQLDDERIEKLTQIYDPKNDSWSLGSSSPFVSAFAETGVTTGVKAPERVYLIDSGTLNYTSNQSYFPKNDTWRIGVAKPTSRMAFSVATLDDMFYAIGGRNFNYTVQWSSDFSVTEYALNEQYTPFGYGTVSATPTPAPTPSPSVNNTSQTGAMPTDFEEFVISPVVIAASAASAVLIVLATVIYFKHKRKATQSAA